MCLVHQDEMWIARYAKKTRAGALTNVRSSALHESSEINFSLERVDLSACHVPGSLGSRLFYLSSSTRRMDAE